MFTNMTKSIFLAAALVASVALVFSVKEAQAVIITGVGPGGAIPDGGVSDGTEPGILTSVIVLGDPGSVGDVTVTITNLQHTWVGDLSFTLTHVDTGTSVDLFHRPGVAGATAPFTFPLFGSATDLNGDFIFNDSFATSIDAATGGAEIAGGSFFAATFDGSQDFLSAFNGESVATVWRLTATDWVNQADIGGFDSWTLELTVAEAAVPEPSSLLLLGSGLVGLAGWRWRKNRAATS